MSSEVLSTYALAGDSSPLLRSKHSVRDMLCPINKEEEDNYGGWAGIDYVSRD